jgi:hypothetical protein
MIGAIAGDMIGSAYEFGGTKNKDSALLGLFFGLTDDSVLTAAVPGFAVFAPADLT